MMSRPMVGRQPPTIKVEITGEPVTGAQWQAWGNLWGRLLAQTVRWPGAAIIADKGRQDNEKLRRNPTG